MSLIVGQLKQAFLFRSSPNTPSSIHSLPNEEGFLFRDIQPMKTAQANFPLLSQADTLTKVYFHYRHKENPKSE